jgi:hypothetical protein
MSSPAALLGQTLFVVTHPIVSWFMDWLGIPLSFRHWSWLVMGKFGSVRFGGIFPEPRTGLSVQFRLFPEP